MKKSNALMLSYLIFLVIALGARIFFEWQGLERIAMAATIAGCFFAFADLASWLISYQTYYTKSLETTVSYLFEINEVAINTANNQKKEAVGIIDIITPYKHRHKEFEDIIDYENGELEKSEKRISEAEASISECNRISTEILKHKKRIDFFKIGELILLVLGFACFFMIVVFDYFVELITKHQAIATIIAFAVIMVNYYLKDAIEDKTKQELDEMIEAAEESKAKYIELDEQYEKHNFLEKATRLVEKIKELDDVKVFHEQESNENDHN